MRRWRCGWREEGAQIVGGCCGVGPEHIAAARERLAGTCPGHRRPDGGPTPTAPRRAPRRAAPAPWTDRRGRSLYPLPFPDLVVRSRGRRPGRRQLHGLAVPLPRGDGRAPALPGRRVRDRDPRRPARAQRGGARARDRHRRAGRAQYARRTRSATAWPSASPPRPSTCTRGCPRSATRSSWRASRRCRSTRSSRSRPTGRSTTGGAAALDQLIGKLPDALAPEGVAYVVQLSILSQRRTLELLDARRVHAPRSSTTTVPLPRRLDDSRTQIAASRSSATPITSGSASTT